MRFSALIPVILGLVALILSFLCLFAGSRKGFMEDYAVVTLNTSRIGENVINTTHPSGGNVITDWIHNLTSTVESDINDDLNSFARSLGLHDFYSAHLMDFCEGYYTPGPVPNATVSGRDIHKNITSCSNRTASFQFQPRNTLQQELNRTGHGNINLTALGWPSAIDDGLKTLHVAQRATFILYCISIGIIGIATLFALASIFLNGRLSAFVNILLTALALLSIGIASAIVTTIAVKATNTINKHGKTVGVNASKGGKFLVLTWVATFLVFLSMLVWCAECVVGRRGHRRSHRDGYVVEK